eukprot:EG_transcript_22305
MSGGLMSLPPVRSGLQPQGSQQLPSSEHTLLGVAACVELLRSLLPETHLVIMGLLPRAKSSKSRTNMAEIGLVNSGLAAAAASAAAAARPARLHFVDCSAVFLWPNGTLRLMPDL